MKRLFLLLFLISLLYCTHDKPLPSGYELLNRENKGEIIAKEYPAERVATFWNSPQAGIQNSLMVGQYNDFKCYSALRFAGYSGIDTANIISATLNLEQFYHSGEGGSFTVNIYPITGPWIDDYIYESNWEAAQWADIVDQHKFDETNLIGSFTASPADTNTIVSISIDPAIVNEWINQYILDSNDDDDDDIDINYGFLLTVEQADIMCQYYSVEVDDHWPNIDIIYNPADEDVDIDTVRVYPYSDATLIKFDTDIPEDQLVEDSEYLNIGNTSGYKTLLQFDVSDIPREATIHHAMISMHVESFEDSTNYLPISVLPVFEDSTWNTVDMVFDSLHEVPTAYAYATTDIFSMSNAEAVSRMSTIVQHWAWNLYKNNGLLLFSGEEGFNTSELFFNSGKNDSTKVPTLEVTYSLPPGHRFSEK